MSIQRTALMNKATVWGLQAMLNRRPLTHHIAAVHTLVSRKPLSSINGQQDHLVEENLNKKVSYMQAQIRVFLERVSEFKWGEEMEKADLEVRKARLKMWIAENVIEKARNEKRKAQLELKLAELELKKAKIKMRNKDLGLEKPEKVTENVDEDMVKLSVELEMAGRDMEIAEKEIEIAKYEMELATMENQLRGLQKVMLKKKEETRNLSSTA